MKNELEKKESITFWLPIVLILAVVPLITIIHMYDNGISGEAWAGKSGETADFFLYYKSRILMILGLVITVLLGTRLMQGDKGCFLEKNAWIHLIPVGVFATFSLVSALFSTHIKEAFWGGYEQFEGVLVILVYVVSFLLVYGYVKKEEVIVFLLNALIIGSLIVSVLGVFQAFKLDWIQSDWARGLLTPELAGRGDFNIKLNFERGMAYSTLHNPNYVGSYVAVALPLTVMLAFWAKSYMFRILAAGSCVCQLIMLYASQSLTGCIGVAGAAAALIVFLIPYARKHIGISVAAAAVMIAWIVVLFIAKPGLLDKFLHDDGDRTAYTIQSIQTKKNSFEIETGSGRKVVGRFASGDTVRSFELTDAKGKKLSTQKGEDGVVTLTEKGYEKIQFAGVALQTSKDEKDVMESLQVRADGKKWNFVKKEGKLRYYNETGKLDKIRKVDSVGFKNNYDFATRRGYIWSRTFPLLPATAFFGIGQDNFIYEFPNDDYVGKVNCSFNGEIITKPHNMYLQIWTQDGMFACLALIALYLMLAVSTFRLCLNGEKKTWLQKVSIAIMCSASGYMIVGLANDSTICVAPVFWVLMALGLAVNRMIVHAEKAELSK